MPSRREIDDCEPAVAERDGAVNVDTLIVRPSVGNDLRHAFDQFRRYGFPVPAEYASNAAHAGS
jgi:hypothetical protein